MLVMGLLVGLISVKISPDDRVLLQIEAERLAQLLSLASEESRFTGKSIRWIADGAGYRFWRLNSDGDWSEIRDNDLLRARALPQGVMVTGLRVEAMPSQGTMNLEFIPYAPPLSFTIEMSLGEERSEVTSSPLGDVHVVLPQTGESNARLSLR